MDYSSIHKTLYIWYNAHGRKTLPWRNTDDSYAIYISEIMLQQTQVKTVLGRFYHPFLSAFPNLESLAQAEEKEVLKYWQGLGYYNRAIHLHKTAKQLATEGYKTLPDDVEMLQSLPGIGRNTAHAIAAFAFHQPVPVMEANVKRVLSRIHAIKEPNDTILWNHAYTLLDQDSPFDYNQAMMDIGAMVCTKAQPQCGACPFAEICQGKTSPNDYPQKKAKKKTPIRKKVIIAHQRIDDGYYWLRPRTSRFLNGLYGFMEHNSEDTASSPEWTSIGHVSQTYSHFQLEAEIYHSPSPSPANDGEYYSIYEIESLPLSRADEKILQLLKKAAL